ncbi:MAG: NUDIX domain-containing protein [Gammaproteobacteria bacterium]
MSVDCRLRFLYKFEYQARFGDVGSEHELCHVFAGYPDGELTVDPTEIADHKWVSPAELTRAIAAEPARYSPWTKLEWQRITDNFLEQILADCNR